MSRPAVLLLAFNAVLVVGVVLVVVSLASGGGGDEPRTQHADARAPERFDSGRAWAELRRQVALGPRPAGSAASRRLAERLRRALPNGRFEPLGPRYPGLRNVVGHLRGTRPAVVVAAHYDTKAIPGFVGANDGASGTAAVVELARVLRSDRRTPRTPELRFVLFDGEEATDDTRPFLETGLRGSQAYAERHDGEVGSLILLDFVAGRDMRIRREAMSDEGLWRRLRTAARRVGAAAYFPAGTGSTITDDHVPFLLRGVPAINLIEWPYRCWHLACDDLSAVSERSLAATGDTVAELVRTLSRP